MNTNKNEYTTVRGSAWVINWNTKFFSCCYRDWATIPTTMGTIGFRVILGDKNEKE